MTLRKRLMAARAAQGLKIVIQDKDGRMVTLYPKNYATKARWLAGYRAKGLTIVES